MEANMAKNFVDKTRSTYCGMKGVVNSEAWGADKATERYGGGTRVHDGHARAVGGQAPQAPEDKHDTKYDNDVKDGWLRGGGPKGAEGRPGYSPSHRAPHGDQGGTRPKIRPGDPGPHR
jgi:hypothetical protein